MQNLNVRLTLRRRNIPEILDNRCFERNGPVPPAAGPINNGVSNRMENLTYDALPKTGFRKKMRSHLFRVKAPFARFK
jgi:hypothetical protein